MQIHRLTEMVFALMGNERVTAKQFAERFEVSARTVYRDIGVLSAAGIPVYTDQGNGGGISIAANYRLDKAILSEAEKQSIITMLTVFDASAHSDDTSKLLQKLSGIFQTESRFIEVDFSDWQNDDRVQRTFDELKRCLTECRVAKIDYCNANGESGLRDVEPLKLIFKHRDWYLYAYCRKRSENRLFKLIRIRKIEALPEKFERVCTEENVSKKLDWKGDIVQVTLKISRSFRGSMDEFYPGDQVSEDENGDCIVKMQSAMDSWMMGFFLSFGDKAEILEPLWLKEELKKIHRRAAEL